MNRKKTIHGQFGNRGKLWKMSSIELATTVLAACLSNQQTPMSYLKSPDFQEC